MTDFLKEFWNITFPIPFQSIYSKDYAKSNDLRLLIEIATGSYLRMHTDPKTGYLHFTCKNKGSACLDIEAFPTDDCQGYYFTVDCTQAKHMKNCGQIEQYGFLKIYNLFKMKKDLIEQFMIQEGLTAEPPSTILTAFSGYTEHYFFQQQIHGSLQLRRKLRKRFDNVVNIDIKKIGKPEEKEIKTPKNKPKMVHKSIIVEKTDQLPEKIFSPSSKIQQDKIGDIQMEPETNKDAVRLDSSLPIRFSIFKEIMEEIEEKEQDNQPQNDLKEAFPEKKKIVKKKKKKSKKKSNKRLRRIRKAEQCSIQNSPQIDIRESIILLAQDHQSFGEQVFIEQRVPQFLPELDMLNQNVEYHWSSSSDSIIDPPDPTLEIFPLNRQDYFKSLRSSTLKRSLEKESLSVQYLMEQPGKQNLN